jgi:hypothetical protein
LQIQLVHSSISEKKRRNDQLLQQTLTSNFL